MWFSRAAELARRYDAVSTGRRQRTEEEEVAGAETRDGEGGKAGRSRWPAVDVEALFPSQADGSGAVAVVEVKEHEKDAHSAADKVDAAKMQEGVGGVGDGGERSGVRVENPKPAPVGSAPESAERAAGEAGAGAGAGGEAEGEDKPMPQSQAREPPLGKCRCVRYSSPFSLSRATVT